LNRLSFFIRLLSVTGASLVVSYGAAGTIEILTIAFSILSASLITVDYDIGHKVS
jgi:hypothetical protein